MKFLRQQLLQRQLQDVIPTNPEEYKALLTPHNYTRRGVDNTTVVFYDFDRKNKYTKLAKESNNLGVTKFSAADAGFKSSFLSYASQIEDIADVRFFNIKKLSKEDRAYLRENNITIPEKPDFVIKYGDRNEMHKADADGYADYPSTLGIQFLIVSDAHKIDPFFEYGNLTVAHELGHIMGLEHPHGEGKNPGTYEPNMSKDHDNLDNTVMTYNKVYVNGFAPDTRFSSTYEDDDILALQAKYGPSKKGKDYYLNTRKPQIEFKSLIRFLKARSLIQGDHDFSDKTVLETYLQKQFSDFLNESKLFYKELSEGAGEVPIIASMNAMRKAIDDGECISFCSEKSHRLLLLSYYKDYQEYSNLPEKTLEKEKQQYTDLYNKYKLALENNCIPEHNKYELSEVFKNGETYNFDTRNRFSEKIALLTKSIQDIDVDTKLYLWLKEAGNDGKTDTEELKAIVQTLKSAGVAEIQILNNTVLPDSLNITSQFGTIHNFKVKDFSPEIKNRTISF